MTTPFDSPLKKANSLYMRRRSSLSNQNPSAMALRTSITKGVKYGDVTLINKRASERGQDEVIPDMAAQKTEGAFDSVRKKYDRLKKQRLDRERSVEKLKQQLLKSKEEQKAYLDKKNQALEVSGNLQRKMTEVKELFDMNIMQQASFNHMRERLKFSNQFQKNKSLGLQIQKRQLKRLLSDSNTKDLNADAESAKTKTLLEILRYEFEKQSQQRESHLETLRQKIDQIQRINAQFQQRDNEIRQIAEKAIQDKDQNQKWWRRALMTNKFVNKFLQNKMHIQMQKFNVVETAFKNIKIATGVLDGPTMVTRYIQKERIYGRLLDSIAKSEKEIDKLNQTKDELLRDKKQLQAQIAQSQANLNKGGQNLNDHYHKLSSINQKNTKSDICSYKIFQWLNKQHKKISHNSTSQLPVFSSNQLNESMNSLFEWLQKHYESMKQDQVQSDFDGYQLDQKKINHEQVLSDAELNQNQIQQQEQFVENQRIQFIKENKKEYDKLKREKKQKEMLLMQQDSKLKFTKLDKTQKAGNDKQKQKVNQKQKQKDGQ